MTAGARLDSLSFSSYVSVEPSHNSLGCFFGVISVKIKNSLKTARARERNCVIVRRKGRLLVINKRHPRYKVRQG